MQFLVHCSKIVTFDVVFACWHNDVVFATNQEIRINELPRLATVEGSLSVIIEEKYDVLPMYAIKLFYKNKN